MSTMKVLNMAGAEVGTVELNDAIFGIEPNEVVVHEVVKNHLANCRQGTQSALTRAEVSGGGRKPWRQKGTGHARQGSTRAPQWTHGGIVFAPKPRSYSFGLNKKAKRLALKSVLSAKVAEGPLGSPGAALTGAAGALLTPGLAAAAGNLSAGQSGLGALTLVCQMILNRVEIGRASCRERV